MDGVSRPPPPPTRLGTIKEQGHKSSECIQVITPQGEVIHNFCHSEDYSGPVIGLLACTLSMALLVPFTWFAMPYLLGSR
ncbi:unnamed protein product, partial [Cyprideis torosa]